MNTTALGANPKTPSGCLLRCPRGVKNTLEMWEQNMLVDDAIAEFMQKKNLIKPGQSGGYALTKFGQNVRKNLLNQLKGMD